MLKYFEKLKGEVQNKRIMKHNPEDEILHRLKDQIFETFYSKNVRTVDVQIIVR